MKVSMEWLRAEAAHQGLRLSEEDLAAVREQLEKVRPALERTVLEETMTLEPPYRFSAT